MSWRQGFCILLGLSILTTLWWNSPVPQPVPRPEYVAVPETIVTISNDDPRIPKSFRDDQARERAIAHDDAARSDLWRTVEKHCIAAHPYCAYCGRTQEQVRALGGSLQAHHIHPFKQMTAAQRGANVPGGELCPGNTIVLCEVHPAGTGPDNHHLGIGHGGNFKNDNPNVVEDCKANEAKLRAVGQWPLQFDKGNDQ